MLDLEPIKARLAKAAPAPWTVDNRSIDGLDDPYLGFDIDGLEQSYMGRGMLAFRGDAEFVAHARTDIPALIAEVELLRGLVSEEAYDARRDKTWQGDDGPEM